MKQDRMRRLAISLFVAVPIFAILLIETEAFGAVFSEKPSSTLGKETIERGIVILVEFPDVTHNVTRDFVQKKFSRQLNGYVKEMSYNKVTLDVDVTQRWYTMSQSISDYRISSRNLEVDKTRVRKLIDDVIDAADKDIDFSSYSFVAIYMGAEVSEYGMIGLCGYPGMLGWSRSDAFTTKSGQLIKGGVAIFSFQAHLGTLFHDIAHILGGVKDGNRMVPCLYDHDLQAEPGPMRETFIGSIINLGFWDPMSCHYYKREIPPPGISSWTRIRLNWIDEAKIKVVTPGTETDVILGPLENGSSKILAIKIPVSETSYYLVENRQPVGFDKNLPGSGILIMYADDTIPECRHGNAPVKLMNADPSVPNLEGATFDIGEKDTFQDNKNRFKIQIKEKKAGSYKIHISGL
jgi:M6 family metalloprotease-like protein